MDASRTPWWWRAAIVVAAAVLVSCGGPTEAGPTCRDTVLANGTAFEDSQTFAIAFSRSLSVNYPELTPIAEEVARYQEGHPDYTLPIDEGVDLQTTGLSYALVLTALAASPEARTPELIRHLVDAARRGGMKYVLAFLHDDVGYPADRYGGAALRTLRDEWGPARAEMRRTVTWNELCPG
jgi:hypothetical protein